MKVDCNSKEKKKESLGSFKFIRDVEFRARATSVGRDVTSVIITV
jgi:hypothetical protein